VNDEDNELRLRVSKDGVIRVDDAPTGFGSQSCPINLSDDENDTRRQTVKAFIDLLKENRLRKESEFQLLGALLYDVLLENEIGADLHRAVEENRAPYLRVVLQFEKGGSLNIAGWPWEYLYCPSVQGRRGGGYFLTSSENLLLSRRTHNAPFDSFRVDRLPVTVLFVASRPVGSEVRWQSVLEKIETFSERTPDNPGGRDPKDVRIKVVALLPDPGDSPVPGATYKTFLATVEEVQPHIIHFVGHGDFDDGHGRVMFMNEDGSARPVTDGQLANDIWRVGRSALKMVFVQACESGRSEPDALLDRYQAVSGIASNLAAKNVPAIVAMQYAVDQDFAEVFACALYEALADAKPVDIAVHEARQAVARRQAEGSSDTAGPAFALPVLYWWRPDALFPSDEAGPSGRRGGEDEQLFCAWCDRDGTKTAVGLSSNFCAFGHPVRCREPEPGRPDGVCGEPVLLIGTHCTRCGKPLPSQVQFDVGPSAQKKLSLTPAARRAPRKKT
jgi:CHAT domain